eukprot:TRINITY_DN78479_c0_g1_i1.p1 TRINITY_DN78479_c0_g1~~TRINITY_DN78479_c0_g1_i1.p1  ORF type:complete len:121 (-),score=22.44 TRINITY_DN78479_c0_g1_i1:38-400(-)
MDNEEWIEKAPGFGRNRANSGYSSSDRESWETRQSRQSSLRRRADSESDPIFNLDAYNAPISPRHYTRFPKDFDSDDDLPSWPMYLGIFMWVVLGVVGFYVWYDETYLRAETEESLREEL